MQIRSYDSARDFLDRAQSYLAQEESVNGLMLGIAIRLEMEFDVDLEQEKPYLLVAEQDGALMGTAVMTPPHKLVIYSHLNPAHEFTTAMGSYLHKHEIPVPGVLGPEHVSNMFASTYHAITEKLFQPGMRQGVYELRSVNEITAVSGNFRIAKAEDVGVITKFVQGFSNDLHDEPVDTPDALSHAQQLIKHGMLYVWEDGEVVSMAASVRPTPNGMSVNLVYTPPEQRRKGYATALVAALSQHLLNEGCQFTTLFTDLANSTSNHIYQEIGYNKVAEFTEYAFLD